MRQPSSNRGGARKKTGYNSTPRSQRYRYVSAGARLGNDSTHSAVGPLEPSRRRRKNRGQVGQLAASHKLHRHYFGVNQSTIAELRGLPDAKRWYAVIRGHVPGIYRGWPSVWPQVDEFTDARCYRFKSVDEAIECFMRYRRGEMIHPKDSTMESRGEIKAYTDGVFFGERSASDELAVCVDGGGIGNCFLAGGSSEKDKMK